MLSSLRQPGPLTHRGWSAALMVMMTVVVGGCAGLPRIDPSGRRLLIWPSTSQNAAAAPGLPGLPSLGNVDVPPVFAGQAPPVVPPPSPGDGPTGSFGAPPAPVANTVRSPVDEELAITPSRLLAPVGSEVILKAGVCSQKGYLRTNRRIEWMLGQEGTGQFVRVGEQGEMDFLRLPWQRPDKHDNAYAVGYTTPFNVCLRRGNDDPSDDVQVERGEAWITLSSASEGVSYVTATAPESKDWDARRATATVYWVDAQWRLPESQTLQPGQTGTLTTTVTRQSDGAPVEGWLVRYEVIRGETARLGYASGQTSEAETDAQGRASVEISPTDNQPGSAAVRVTVIRPPRSAPMPSPRLEVGSGEATVTWTPAARPPIVSPGGPGTPGGPIDRPDDRPTPPRPFEPPPVVDDDDDTLGQRDPRIGPRLEVTLQRESTGPIRAGDAVPVRITVRNTGDEPAQNLSLGVEYDRGLSNAFDVQGLGELTYPADRLPDLGPEESNSIPLEFTAVEAGRHCYNVTVSADGAASGFERQCLDVQSPPPPARPQLRIEAQANAIGTVGGTVSYLATIYNDGPVAVEDVRVEILNAAELRSVRWTEGAGEVPNGLGWSGERIEAGGSLRLQVEYECLQSTDAAAITIYALVGGEEAAQRTDGVEVLPARAPPTPPPADSPITATIRSQANPARVGSTTTVDVVIANTTTQPIENVQYRVLFPPQLRPTDLRGGTQSGSALEFPAIATLPPGEPYRLTIPCTPTQQARQVAVQLQTRIGTGPPETVEDIIAIESR